MAEMTYCGKVLVRGFIFPRLREEGVSPEESNTHRAADKIRQKPRSKLEKSLSCKEKNGYFYMICDYCTYRDWVTRWIKLLMPFMD
jgi:hypothetical protein